MPIKGLTDRQAAFPEIGRIRKGGPKQANKPGEDLTYFRIELDENETRAATILAEAYPEKPSELNILLPFNSVDENFDAWREAYVAGGLVHRCDGEYIWYEINPQTGERIIGSDMSEQVNMSKRCDGSSGCKPSGRLKVLIPELQRLAYLTVLTGSIHDVMNISRQLEALLQINGKLAGVPLKLRRRPVAISTPSGPDGKRARRVKSLLSIEADPDWVRHKLQSMKVAALPEYEGSEELPALVAPEEPDDDWTVEEENDINGDDPGNTPSEEQDLHYAGKKGWTPEKIAEIRPALIEARVIPPDAHPKHLTALLDLTPFGIEVPAKELVGWGKIYRGAKDAGANSADAAAIATKGWMDPEVSGDKPKADAPEEPPLPF